MLATIPQLLASQGVPQPDIASVTAIGLSPGFFYFFASPILDVRFSRKLYAYVLGGLTALLLFAALMSTDNLALLSALLFSGQFAVVLYSSAVGGWLSGLTRAEDEARLSAWFTMGNFGGYGATAMVGITMLRVSSVHRRRRLAESDHPAAADSCFPSCRRRRRTAAWPVRASAVFSLTSWHF